MLTFGKSVFVSQPLSFKLKKKSLLTLSLK